MQVMTTILKDKFFEHNATIQHNASFEQFVSVYHNEWFRMGRHFPGSGHVDPQALEIEWEAHSNHERLFNQIVILENFDTDIEKVNRDTGNG